MSPIFVSVYLHNTKSWQNCMCFHALMCGSSRNTEKRLGHLAITRSHAVFLLLQKRPLLASAQET